jgi:hypothetical protein
MIQYCHLGHPMLRVLFITDGSAICWKNNTTVKHKFRTDRWKEGETPHPNFFAVNLSDPNWTVSKDGPLRMTTFYRCTLENKLQNVRPDEIEGDEVALWGEGWMLFIGRFTLLSGILEKRRIYIAGVSFSPRTPYKWELSFIYFLLII